MNKFPSMLAVGLLIGASTGVAATSASDAQRYCEDIQQGQQKAQEEYVKIYTPEVNPTEVFQNSITPCMDQISQYVGGLSIPGLGSIQGLIDKIGKELLEKGCQAAKQEAQSAGQRAIESVRRRANEKSNGKYSQVMGTVGSQVGTVVPGSAGETAGRVMNILQ